MKYPGSGFDIEFFQGTPGGVNSLFRRIRRVSMPERLDGLSFLPDIRKQAIVFGEHDEPDTPGWAGSPHVVVGRR